MLVRACAFWGGSLLSDRRQPVVDVDHDGGCDVGDTRYGSDEAAVIDRRQTETVILELDVVGDHDNVCSFSGSCLCS